jgi:hypothetical protein
MKLIDKVQAGGAAEIEAQIAAEKAKSLTQKPASA